MRIAILTSSRADYGIYLPLLKALKNDPFFDFQIVAFGTHLSPFHGCSINQIRKDGFDVQYKIESMLAGDTKNSIATALALTSLKFADFWKDHEDDFDLVFCLGDRYEMFAAVTAGIPFGIPFAHIHGGEKTLGVIDNIFRHAITLTAKYHFVSCDSHARRVAVLIESDKYIFNVGSLSLDNLKTMNLLDKRDFFDRFKIDLNHPTILVTLHPETVCPDKNEEYADVLAKVLLELEDYQVLITLPNADTSSFVIRKRFLQLPEQSRNRIHCYENLGSQDYFTAMKYSYFLLGNTSSGIIEAASFNKWVINVGNRQLGREQSKNTLSAPFDPQIIFQLIEKIEKSPAFEGENIYYQENTAERICSIIKNHNEKLC